MMNNNDNAIKDFASYLKQSVFVNDVIDLRHTSLIENVEKYIECNKHRFVDMYSHYTSLLRTLRMIEDKFDTTLKSHQVSEEFWDYFILFSLDRGLNISSIGTTISQLRAALDWSSRHGAKLSPTMDSVKVSHVDSIKIAFSEADVSRIYYFDINTIPRRSQFRRRLERIKDMFVLSCCLGQRYSDMVRINASCFDRNIFRIRQKKTNNMAYVDINKMSIDKHIVYEILNKYDYEAPYKETVAPYDRGLHELFKYVGFTDMILHSYRSDGRCVDEKIPKWKIMGSHSARRTFITNNILRRFSIQEVMRASGHVSYSSFRKYLCFDD